MRDPAKKIGEGRGGYLARGGRQLPRNPMRNIPTAARMIVRAHERAFKELQKF